MKNNTRFAWWIFAATCLISLVGFGLIINTVGLFYDPVGLAFHVNRADVALMTTFQNIAAAIVLLFAGKIMNRVSVKWLLTGCFSIIGLGLLSLSVAHSILHFYVVWTLIGICQPFAILLSIPVLLGSWFEEKLGTVMGISLGISAIGGAIFNPIISSVITSAGWRTGWLVEALIVLIILIPTCVLLKDKPGNGLLPYGYNSERKENLDDVEKSGFSFKETLRTPMFYLILISMIALQFVAGFVQHISAHIVNVGMPLTVGASVISGVMLGAAVGKISIGYFLDKFNNNLVVAVYTIFGFLGWGGLLTMRSATLLIASGFVLGMGQGILLVALPFFIRKQFGAKDYSNILSVINMFGAVSSAAAVGIDGVFFDISKSYSVPLLLNVILYVISGMAIITSIVFSKKTSFKEVNSNAD